MMNHNEERFAQLTGNSLVEFQQAWDELVRYANSEASQYFHASIGREDAVEEVMSGNEGSIESWLIKVLHNPGTLENIKDPWGYLKIRLKNRIKKLSDEREERPIKAKESIIFMYAIGVEKSDIAREVECSERHVRRVIQNSPEEIEELRALKASLE